jgi:hypothetical protein
LPTAPAAAPVFAGLTRLRALLVREIYQLVPVPGGRARWSGPAVFVAAALLSLLRVRPSQWDTLWAEDGHQFLQQALADSPLAAVVHPYAGYLHLYPRLAAEAATGVPLPLAGGVFSVAAAAVVGLAAWTVWTLAAAHLASPWFRGALTAAVVLLPAGGLEAINNVANSHFYLIVASFWALLACRPGRLRQIVPSLTVALAALSDPVAGALLPLALGRLVAVRSWRDRTVALVYLAALALQLTVVASAAADRESGEVPASGDIAFGYAIRVLCSSVLGVGGTHRLADNGGHWAVLALAGLVVLVLTTACLVARRRLFLIAACGIASVAFFTVACLFALGGDFPPTGAAATNLFAGSRYSIVPVVLLLTALALAAQGLAERLPSGWARTVTAAALVPLAFFVAYDYRSDAGPRLGMSSWSDQITQATMGCRGQADNVVRVLVVAPTPEWNVHIPCRLLRAGA